MLLLFVVTPTFSFSPCSTPDFIRGTSRSSEIKEDTRLCVAKGVARVEDRDMDTRDFGRAGGPIDPFVFTRALLVRTEVFPGREGVSDGRLSEVTDGGRDNAGVEGSRR
jgi:hypothetical protein